MLIQENLSIEEKLSILSDAAKYDAACTSSGVGRKGKEGFLGNSRVDGICHSFASDGRCISLLKILFTNQCIYDCHYCVNRRSNDTVRTSFTPEEVCRLTMEFYRRNYIEGLFLSSGVLDTPDYTMELLYQTLYRLRRIHRFNGYIHVKAIPGADPELIERVGFLADRMRIWSFRRLMVWRAWRRERRGTRYCARCARSRPGSRDSWIRKDAWRAEGHGFRGKSAEKFRFREMGELKLVVKR